MSTSVLPAAYILKHLPSGKYCIGHTAKPAAWKWHSRKKLDLGQFRPQELQQLYTCWTEMRFEWVTCDSVRDALAKSSDMKRCALEDPLCVNAKPIARKTQLLVPDVDFNEDLLEYSNVMGAYVITHIPSGWFYVGSTNNIHLRMKGHLLLLKKGVHGNRNLQTVVTNVDDLKLEFLETPTYLKARELEQSLLDKFHGKELCCNIGTGAEKLWLKLPDHVKSAMSEGRKKSEKWRDAIKRRGNAHRIGSKVNAQGRANISKGHESNGKNVSIEGIVYPNKVVAAKTLGISVAAVEGRIKSTTLRYRNWIKAYTK